MTEQSDTYVDPCKCHESWATISPFHPGHCCFWPVDQDCHPAEIAEWERKRDELRAST